MSELETVIESDQSPPAIQPTKLFNKNFILLWQGQLVSQLGTQAFVLAMQLWIKDTTGSATLMGVLSMLSSIPGVLLGPIAGTFADRHSRRNIIIICDFLCGLALFSLVASIFLIPHASTLILTWLFITAIFVAILQAFFRPAIQASIPDIVPTEKLHSANSLNQSTLQLATVFGPGIGGVLYTIFGAPLLFLINACTFTFSAISELFVKIPQQIAKKSQAKRGLLNDFKADIIEGFQFVWNRKGMRNFFFAVAVLNFFTVPFGLLLPFFVTDSLHAGNEWYGFLLAAFGFGSLTGYIVAGLIKLSAHKRSLVLPFLLIGFSAVLASMGFVRNSWIALVIFLIMGVASGIINITIITILQLSTPSAIRGRVFGFLSTIAAGLSPISMGLAGVVADLLHQNIPLIYFCAGMIGTLLSALISLSKDFRHFLAYEPEVSNQAGTTSAGSDG
ncbi:MFS transporter [Candidatus Acetothermia bacterium]|nr:MFS transporter [Candidatus Acetothermia bacterium]MBI3644230.1 MFS transporter [Candidatus Acetothermia bacterium]